HSNYPNPFNPSTTIKFEVADFTDVTVEIYDILGNKINTLFKGKKAVGAHEIVWNGKNSAGVSVSSGLYFYKMKTKKFTKTKKMMLLK
ncbi:MAG TPA: T9SS type A sorting domain-containing protein, partial [Caldithrix sp.]|nr:T9SS type A sorting domain-containing protein [Caldithrix sp.]